MTHTDYRLDRQSWGSLQVPEKWRVYRRHDNVFVGNLYHDLNDRSWWMIRKTRRDTFENVRTTRNNLKFGTKRAVLQQLERLEKNDAPKVEQLRLSGDEESGTS